MKLPTSQQVAICVGAEIREARLNSTGMSQEDLAEEADLDPSTPSLHERGARCPTLWSLINYCLVMRVDPAGMIEGTMKRLKANKWVD